MKRAAHSKPTRRQALQLGSVVLLLGVQHIARGATIVAVRVWPSKDYTRMTIESDGELKAKQFFISDPPRLAVDIEGIDLIPALRAASAPTTSTSTSSTALTATRRWRKPWKHCLLYCPPGVSPATLTRNVMV